LFNEKKKDKIPNSFGILSKKKEKHGEEK